MKPSRIDLLWPYPPGSTRKPAQIEVVVDLDDHTRWVSSFFDTHHYNQGVKGFRGLGPEQPWRHGNRLVIVRELSEAAVREAVVGLLAAGQFAEAFESIGDVPEDERTSPP
jgi:hypothetical protein